MSALLSIALGLDRAGFRKPLSRLATLAYHWRSSGRQKFLVDTEGRWINCQLEATIVSPTVHTTSYSEFQNWVLDNWCWQYLPRSGDTVIDVGAGVGEEAVIFSRLVGPTGRVISIEAHPQTFACLQETIRRSGLANVMPLCLALADKDGSAVIADIGDHLSSSIVTGSRGRTVQTRSLDSLVAELGIVEVALLKMNIEGAERLAVGGMEHASARISNVCISCHDFIADRDGNDAFRTRAHVRPRLESFGYRLKSRPEHTDAWVRDYFYGTRAMPEGTK